MFIRQKVSGGIAYLQLVENVREGSKVKQTVIRTLGRADEVRREGSLEGLARSAGKQCDALMILEAHSRGEAPVVDTARIGPALVFERLWKETGCSKVLAGLLESRGFGFDVERAIFLTVLHRLMNPGSDRSAERWRHDYRIRGVGSLQLHQLYRAMAWLGEELPPEEQGGKTPFAPRCVKDQVEEALFAHRQAGKEPDRTLMLLDTTSLYFHGRGGRTLGRRGHSKDHRPQDRQMVMALVIDRSGWPVCCELWPGNTADVTSLLPVVNRLQTRFHLRDVCIVADRGMMSADAANRLESNPHGWKYILGARLRSHNEVKFDVLSRAGRYSTVYERKQEGPKKQRSALKVKEVWVEDRRYVACLNEDKRVTDKAERLSILESLQKQLRHGGDKSLVGNRGYRRFLRKVDLEVDWGAVQREERYDGKWVLRTNTDWAAADVALAYKQLWELEANFRMIKSLMDTRPIFHKTDETIRGHVFCSFLALLLRKTMLARLEAAELDLEWDDVLRDLDNLTETDVEYSGRRARLRSQAKGSCGHVFKAVGVALPPTIQMLA